MFRLYVYCLHVHVHVSYFTDFCGELNGCTFVMPVLLVTTLSQSPCLNDSLLDKFLVLNFESDNIVWHDMYALCRRKLMHGVLYIANLCDLHVHVHVHVTALQWQLDRWIQQVFAACSDIMAYVYHLHQANYWCQCFKEYNCTLTIYVICNCRLTAYCTRMPVMCLPVIQ